MWDALTFLREFEGKGFRDVVEYLPDFNGWTQDSSRAAVPGRAPRKMIGPNLPCPRPTWTTPPSLYRSAQTGHCSLDQADLLQVCKQLHGIVKHVDERHLGDKVKAILFRLAAIEIIQI